MIGRIALHLDRRRDRLIVQNLHFESKVRVTRAHRRAVQLALEAFAAFHGADEVQAER